PFSISLISPYLPYFSSLFFFFNHTSTTEIYTLSLHDALPIFVDKTDHLEIAVLSLVTLAVLAVLRPRSRTLDAFLVALVVSLLVDRKSTRLNSSHDQISYAVFCLKKKKKKKTKLLSLILKINT